MPDWSFRLLRVLAWLAVGFATSLVVAWGACILHAKGGWRRTAFAQGRSAQRFLGPEARPDRFGAGGDAGWAGPYLSLFDDLSTRTPERAGFDPDSLQIVEFRNRGLGVRTTQVGCYLLAARNSEPAEFAPADDWVHGSGAHTDLASIPAGFDLETVRIDAGWPMPAWTTWIELSGNPNRYAWTGSSPLDMRVRGDAGMLFRKSPTRNLANDVWPTPSGVPLPFLPAWPGVLVNTLASSGASLGVYGVILGLRRIRRRRRGLCPRCGYASKGLATCPECGAAGQERRPSVSVPGA